MLVGESNCNYNTLQRLSKAVKHCLSIRLKSKPVELNWVMYVNRSRINRHRTLCEMKFKTRIDLAFVVILA